MASVYSVGQVNSYIKNMFTQDFMLTHISVKGEVSNCKYHSSGHIYFSLKDKDGVISCVMFKGNRRGLCFTMEEGQKVVVTGRVDVYERDGKYQLYASQIELDGLGDLYARFEEKKRELEEMGMFAPEYKKPIPKYATRVGIVTAATGAAIQDIINISTRRNPYVQLILYPSLVQGAMAAPDIVNGIRCLDEMDVDVIIVGRGGGSIEDLWAFNEEIVARAVFECNTPVISAVGHETDVTIIDYVADQRAPTPSAAAELAVFEYDRYVSDMGDMQYTMRRSLERKIALMRSRAEALRLRIEKMSPEAVIRDRRMYLDELQNRMESAVYDKLNDRKYTLGILTEKLNGLSPLKRISGGYAYVSNKDKAVTDIDMINVGDDIDIYLRNGTARANVVEIKKGEING